METYGQILRALRQSRQMTQRELAERADMRAGTYGNVESSPFRVVKRARVERLLAVLEAPAPTRERCLEAYDKTPLSDFGKKRADHFAKLHAQRKATRERPRLLRIVVDLLRLYPVDCICEDETDSCPACDAIRVLDPNVARFPRTRTEADELINRIDNELALEAERAAAARTSKSAVDKPVESVDNLEDFG